MIRLNEVKKTYENKNIRTEALKGISMEIADGECVAIMGKSGSGKSTLLNVIGCMDNVTAGEYWLDEKNIADMKASRLHSIRKDNISFVFQNFALLDQYSVFENIELPLVAKNVSKKNRKQIVAKFMQKMGIEDISRKRPSQISGGQQQRVAIARALASDNKIILADEPTGSLDQKTGNEIMDILLDINKQGKTVIIVTHDSNIADRCNRVIHIEDGVVV